MRTLLCKRHTNPQRNTNRIGLENTDGVKSGIYVSFADTAATNGVDFPAEGWDNKYWTVSGENVTWKNA